jgi:transcriptional regulator with PAS, ATPase and Fis domain
MQSKMLRVLQDRQIRSVGSNQNRSVDVRIITATNRELKEDIQAGRFRKDLYYRLNVIPIHIPPLRERPEDIPLLAEAFLRKHGGDRTFSLSPAAQSYLQRGTWEGNARELENVIERAIAFAKSERLEPTDLLLPDDVGIDDSQRNVGEFLDQAVALELTLTELDDRYITRVLESTNGNKARAAKILGINRRTLYRRGFGGSEEACRPAKVS